VSADAVTFAFGDLSAQAYGLARVGQTEEGASALALLFLGREPVAVLAEGGATEALRVAGEGPWSVRFADSSGAGFDLEFTAIGDPADVSPEVAEAGGMQGLEQLCRVTGTVRDATGKTVSVDALGQRGHQWGAPDWEDLALARTVTAWMAPDLAIAVTAIRQAGARGHDEEAIWGALLGEHGPTPIAEPRLSTTYDTDGRQQRAGLELWLSDDDGWARRAAGEVLCGSTLDLGRLRLDCAFFRWTMEGREGVGRYDLLRRPSGD